MHRSEARARFVRRVGPLVAGAAVLSSGAYFVAKSFKSESAKSDGRPTTVPSAESSAGALAAGSASSVRASPRVGSSSDVAGASSVAVTPTPTRAIATPVVASPAGKPGVQRIISFRSIQPSFGVHMTIDGVAGPDPDPRKPFAIDDKAHTLVFTCTGDLCAPKTVPLMAGGQDESLSVELQVPPARLVVDGDSSHSYGIEEVPNLILSNGQEAEVPMTAGTRPVTIFDRIDPAKKQSITLRSGKRETVAFKAQ
jgi:hypothetical protein